MPNLTTCVDCRGAVSTNATKCPHCGRMWPIAGTKEEVERHLAILPFLFALPFVLAMGYCALM